jgi:hypothetical protein
VPTILENCNDSNGVMVDQTFLISWDEALCRTSTYLLIEDATGMMKTLRFSMVSELLSLIRRRSVLPYDASRRVGIRLVKNLPRDLSQAYNQERILKISGQLEILPNEVAGFLVNSW